MSKGHTVIIFLPNSREGEKFPCKHSASAQNIYESRGGAETFGWYLREIKDEKRKSAFANGRIVFYRSDKKSGENWLRELSGLNYRARTQNGAVNLGRGGARVLG